jgi:hypothetical protein
MTIRDLLIGCVAGRLQRVGVMSVLPLTAEKKYQNEDFVSPQDVRTANSTYGEMKFINDGQKTVIIPSHAAYMTKEFVQDHAMVKSGFVKGWKTKTYNDAACIQSSQCGTFREAKREVSILPWSLREIATSKRGLVQYSKLWPEIADFNKQSGILAHGHLVYFYDKFVKELEQFVAQFELVPNQIGAIVLINGTVFGIERTPNAAYFKDIFETLIRSCYGAVALRVSQGINPAKAEEYKLYSHIDPNVKSISEVISNYKKALAAEKKIADDIIIGLLDEILSEKTDEEEEDLTAKTIENKQIIGQTIITSAGNPVYTSVVVKKEWLKGQSWYKAPMFQL